MANLIESPAYEAGVYQLEENDPLQGGANGIDNLPHKHLANRTAWLKGQVDALASANDQHVGAGGAAHALATVVSAGFMSAPDKVALNGAASSTALAALAGLFTGVLATNGYLRVPMKVSGADRTLIVQWGSTTSTLPSSTRRVTFPIAFPAACANIHATHIGYGGSIAAVSEVTTTNFLLSMCQEFNGCPEQTEAYAAFWLAFGY